MRKLQRVGFKSEERRAHVTVKQSERFQNEHNLGVSRKLLPEVDQLSGLTGFDNGIDVQRELEQLLGFVVFGKLNRAIRATACQRFYHLPNGLGYAAIR